MNAQSLQGPIENPPLVEAMHTIAEDDNTETRETLYRTLKESTLIVPTAESMLELPEEDAHVMLVSIVDDDDNTFLPVFTDEEALSAWSPEGCPYVAIRAEDLFGMTLSNEENSGMVINPASLPSGVITRPELDILVCGLFPEFDETGSLQLMAPDDTEVAISPAEDIEDPVTTKLKNLLSEFSPILQGYAFFMEMADSEEMLTIGIDLDGAIDPTTIHDIMTELANRLLNELGDVQLMILEPDILAAVSGMTSPFFVRPSE